MAGGSSLLFCGVPSQNTWWRSTSHFLFCSRCGKGARSGSLRPAADAPLWRLLRLAPQRSGGFAELCESLRVSPSAGGRGVENLFHRTRRFLGSVAPCSGGMETAAGRSEGRGCRDVGWRGRIAPVSILFADGLRVLETRQLFAGVPDAAGDGRAASVGSRAGGQTFFGG